MRGDDEFVAVTSFPFLLVNDIGFGSVPGRFRPQEQRRCALPGCDNYSLRDYCSGAHCNEHRTRQKSSRPGTTNKEG